MATRLAPELEQQASKATVLDLFAVPVGRFLWPDSEALNAELKRVILAKLESSPGVVKTNRGGWQSTADLQNWPDECIQTFVRRAHALVREMTRRIVPNATDAHLDGWEMIAWANVNEKGAYNTAHNHYGFGTIWSSFYYVDPGEAAPGRVTSGFTVFQDRSGVPQETFSDPDPFRREVAVVPQAGLMLVFPSTLYHYVEPYGGDRKRVTIAFNMKHPDFVIPMYEDMEPSTWWWRNFRGLMILPRKIPEKLRALALVPAKLHSRQLPRTVHPGPWLEHIRAAIDQATAEASAASQGRRPSAKSRLT